MKIIFVSIGKSHDKILKDSIEEFSARISRAYVLEWKLISSSKKTNDAGKKDEADAIEKIINPGDYLVSLDERGKMFSSVECAQFLQKRMNEGSKRIVFIIGGSYGLHHTIINKSQLVLSLSKLTFPHQLVRLIIAEQVYRALTIIKGEKYHHE